MRTDDLIDALAAQAGPVRPLAGPVTRALRWLALATVPAVVIAVLMSPRPDLAERFADTRFLVEQAAALLTALAASAAALAASIPGSDWRIMLLPIIPGAVWLSSLSLGCLPVILGSSPVSLTPEPECLFYIALIGAIPVMILVAMLRRGLMFLPRWGMALATLAAAAIGNFGLRLFHMQDAALMVLVWQAGSVLLLAGLAGLAGPFVLRAGTAG